MVSPGTMPVAATVVPRLPCWVRFIAIVPALTDWLAVVVDVNEPNVPSPATPAAPATSSTEASPFSTVAWVCVRIGDSFRWALGV